MLQKKTMIEFFKHSFGLCGDGHPSLLYVLGIIPFLRIIRIKVVLYLKSFLKRFYLRSYRN